MTTNELNSRYGAPGRIVFRDGFAGYPNVVLAGQYGSAEISLLGANVLSYRPTGHSPVIFRPAKGDREYNRGDGFHGGIPACWPQFGNRMDKSLPQHGFARFMVFDVRSTEYTEEKTEIALGLRSDEDTKRIWPHDFELEIRISVTMKLNLEMTTTNTGDEPFAFSCGFHPYFSVRERDGVIVKGLDGVPYVDASGAEIVEGVQDGDLKVDFAPDHIFNLPAAVKHEFALLDSGLRRAIAVVMTGGERLIVWNCGEKDPMVDYGPDDWRKYVCVEPVSDWPVGRTLGPGERHRLMAAIQAHLDETCA